MKNSIMQNKTLLIKNIVDFDMMNSPLRLYHNYLTKLVQSQTKNKETK